MDPLVFYYTVQDLQQGSVQVVCSEEVMPLGVRRQRAKRMAEQAAFEARMFTLQGEIILSLPGASDYRDGYEWWTGYDLNERDRRLTPEEQYAAGRWLLLPGGSGGNARYVDDILNLRSVKVGRVNKVLPTQGAGAHTGFKCDPQTGKITGHTTFDENAFITQRTDITGSAHRWHTDPSYAYSWTAQPSS